MKLFEEKKDCCGCGACQSVCPKNAIVMSFDEYGCAYPEINRDKCVDCGACVRVCPMPRRDRVSVPEKAYAAADSTDGILSSASGGVFFSLGSSALKNGAVLFGCAWSTESDTLTPIMTSARNRDELELLQGSKYVQAEANGFYRAVKDELDAGKEVVFSGTPCQNAALKNYLGKPYDGLYLIDIICHGVPGTEFFRDFVRQYEDDHRKKVKYIRFRDKIHSWGLNGSVTLSKNKEVGKKTMYEKECSYYSYFLRSLTYRESCYSCPYACDERAGDLTIGDFWGIETEHPELVEAGALSIDRGVSCVLVNTARGEKLLERFGGKLILYPSEFQKIAAHNEQLRKPSSKGSERDTVMESYRLKGYKGVEECFSKEKTLKWRGKWISRRIKRRLKSF